jgi:hypothetical protein
MDFLQGQYVMYGPVRIILTWDDLLELYFIVRIIFYLILFFITFMSLRARSRSLIKTKVHLPQTQVQSAEFDY